MKNEEEKEEKWINLSKMFTHSKIVYIVIELQFTERIR